MSLLDDLNEAAQTRLGGTPCMTCSTLEKLEPEEVEQIDSLILSGGLSRSRVSRILREHGYDVGESSIGNHYRNGHHQR